MKTLGALAKYVVAYARTLFSHIRAGSRFWARRPKAYVPKRLGTECNGMLISLYSRVNTMPSTKAEPLQRFQVTTRQHDGKRMRSYKNDCLPNFEYVFGEGNNWRDDDPRIKDRLDVVEDWFSNYWNKRLPSTMGLNNRVNYELDLRHAVNGAIAAVYEKWRLKLQDDFHREFDPLMNFLDSK